MCHLIIMGGSICRKRFFVSLDKLRVLPPAGTYDAAGIGRAGRMTTMGGFINGSHINVQDTAPPIYSTGAQRISIFRIDSTLGVVLMLTIRPVLMMLFS